MRTMLFGALLISGAALSAGNISPTLDITTVRIEVTWVESDQAIRREAVKYGAVLQLEPVGASRTYTGRHHGFSVLVRRGEELICRIYAMRPQKVDDERTTALGHELAHCLLGQYHK